MLSASDTRWSTDPRAHVTVYKPPCGRPGCGRGCNRWSRCACGVNLGRCEGHQADGDLVKLRAEHRCADRRAA